MPSLLQTAAKIFPAADRGCTETVNFRSYHTFNFGNYQYNHKKPFGPLRVLNDETLAGSQRLQLFIEEETLVVLLPIVGGIEVNNGGETVFVEAGQVHLLGKSAGSAINITNPYEEDLVNYLQIHLRSKGLPFSKSYSFTIEGNNEKFAPLFPPVDQEGFYLKAVIKKFSGREEAVYSPASEKTKLMAFVLQGAFELEGRLLESRDALALWGTEAIELEALSNEAIVLLLELGDGK